MKKIVAWWVARTREEKILLSLAGVFALVGIALRLFRITKNDFIFYDEGYYLNYNREVMQFISQYKARGFGDMFMPFLTYLRFSLAGAKALWFLVVNARIYFVGPEGWFFPRVVSSLAGIVTLGLTYRFAARYFKSSLVGWLSLIMLAILPSHVFYSRLGLQEGLSTLLVLAGFYFYIFPSRFGWRTFLSGVLLAAAFFSNYRLIILPLWIVLTEGWQAFAQKEKYQLRKVVWNVLTFFSCVFLIGALDGGKNTVITFGWMFHQANLAQKQFDLINLFSFPYYIFRLENWLFGLLFFGNLYFIVRKQWARLFPFLLVCLQMLIFSFASEKGARYMCVMTTFMVMAVASLLVSLYAGSSREIKIAIFAGWLIMVSFLTFKSVQLALFRSDYFASAQYVLQQAPGMKFVTTQNYVQNLFVHDPNRVLPCPTRIEKLIQLYRQGYRYLILDPQSYISWTENEERFNPRLAGYLGFLRATIKPTKVFPHFNDLILERFVFDHNENLTRSIRFLNQSHRLGLGQIRVYDLGPTINQVLIFLSSGR